MKLDDFAFSVHDTSQFPVVLFKQTEAQPGYAAQWEQEMVALLQFDRPFVVVYDQLRTEESHEDRKHRGMWLKQHKVALGRVCKGLISIEPDQDRREAVEAMSAMATKAFGIAHHVVASTAEATAIAYRLTGSQGQA